MIKFIKNLFSNLSHPPPKIGELWNIKQSSPFRPHFVVEILDLKLDKYGLEWIKIKPFYFKDLESTNQIKCPEPPDPIGLRLEWPVYKFIRDYEFYRNKKDI